MLYVNEAEYQRALAKWLMDNQWQVTLEKTISRPYSAVVTDKKGRTFSKDCSEIVGRIDIFATKGNASLIIEAKIGARFAKSAVQQLLKYSPYFPKAQLWFACPEPVAPEVIQMLSGHGITAVPTESLGLKSGAQIRIERLRQENPASEASDSDVEEVLKKKAVSVAKTRKCRCRSKLFYGSFERIDCWGKSTYRINLVCSNARCTAIQQVLIQP